jgi:hypothetical protein
LKSDLPQKYTIVLTSLPLPPPPATATYLAGKLYIKTPLRCTSASTYPELWTTRVGSLISSFSIIVIAIHEGLLPDCLALPGHS